MRVTQLMIVEAIKESGEKGMSMVEIQTKFSMKSAPKNTIDLILSAENSPIYREKETNTSSGRGIQYRYYFRTPVVETKPNEENKNAEGYSDPTAAKAIKNLERTNGFMPGGIYEFRTRPGSFFLIINAENPECAYGYVVGKSSKDESDAYTVCWQAGKHFDLVKTHQLTYAKYGWLNKLFDRRCPFQPLKDILARSPLRNVSVVKITDDEDMVKSKAIDLADDYIGTYCNRLAKALGSPMEFTKDHYSSIAEWADGLLACVSVNYANYERLMNRANLLDKQVNELQAQYGKCNEDRYRYLDILDQVWSELAFNEDNTYNDIVEAVKTLKENSVDTSSVGNTIHALRREACIWKYAFDKVTGGTISENLD